MRKMPRRIPASWMAIALVSSGLLLAACDRKDAGRSTSTSPGATPQGGKRASDQKAHEGHESMFFPSGREEGSWPVSPGGLSRTGPQVVVGAFDADEEHIH